MGSKKRADNFMKDISTEKDWEALLEYQVLYFPNYFPH